MKNIKFISIIVLIVINSNTLKANIFSNENKNDLIEKMAKNQNIDNKVSQLKAGNSFLIGSKILVNSLYYNIDPPFCSKNKIMNSINKKNNNFLIPNHVNQVNEIKDCILTEALAAVYSLGFKEGTRELVDFQSCLGAFALVDLVSLAVTDGADAYEVAESITEEIEFCAKENMENIQNWDADIFSDAMEELESGVSGCFE